MVKMKHSDKKSQGFMGIIVVLLLLVTMIFAVAISMNLLLSPLQEMSDEINNDPMMTEQAKEIIQASENHFEEFWDGVIVFMLVLFWIINIIAAFFIDSHPVFFIIAFIFLIFTFFVIALISNEYESLTNSDSMIDNQQYFTNTIWIMSHILEIVIAMSVTLLIPVFTKIL